MGLSHSPSIVTDGLALYLDAANSKSYPGTGTVWADLSGNGRNGTLVNGVSIANGLANFDGTNDYVNLPDLTNIRLTDVSFGFFCKFASTAGDRDLLNKGVHTTGVPAIVWFDKTVGGGDVGVGNTDSLSVMFFDGTTQHWVATDSNSIVSGVYYYIVAICKPSTGQILIYINGNLSKSNTKTWNGIQNIDTVFRLGAGGNDVNFHSGEIPIFQIYTKALTASEVQQNFNAIRGRYGI